MKCRLAEAISKEGFALFCSVAGGWAGGRTGGWLSMAWRVVARSSCFPLGVALALWLLVYNKMGNLKLLASQCGSSGLLLALGGAARNGTEENGKLARCLS